MAAKNKHGIMKKSDDYLRKVFMQMPAIICMLHGPKHVFEFANEMYMKLIGQRAIIGKPFREALPELKGQGFFELLDEVYKTGKTYTGNETLATLDRGNGECEDGFFNFEFQSTYDDKGNKEGILVFATEVTDQVIARKKYEIESKQKSEELDLQKTERIKRETELEIANKELVFQENEKEKRAAELILANKELVFQNNEKEKRAAELGIANKELIFQNNEKEKRAEELGIANKELVYQNNEKEKRAAELGIANKELETLNHSVKLASQYARSLIEASRDPLFAISTEGKITDMNDAALKITELSREELFDTNFINYFTEPDKAREGYQQVFAKGFVADYPLTIMDGKETPALFNGSVYKDDKGKVLGAVIVARVITEQKRFEKELTEARIFAELATEIAEEAKSKAESATLIANDAVKSKQQFLSNMSHEIRTPMNAIIGFTKVVLKTELTTKQKEYLNAIKISGDALIVLINDILDLAKVDSGKMTFEQVPFKLSLSLSAMLHLFETKIQEKNLVLVKEYDNKIPQVLVGDPVRLHQIILNLVSNAVKFTNYGKITVSVRLMSEDEEQATIEFAVADTGIGITDHKIVNIFENFQQATSGTSRLYGGTGLGLAIVKQLVEPQGGTIQVKSKLNVGSVFSFTLPFQKTNAAAELETEIFELDTEIKNIKVLVVEDMALNQLLMKTLLDDYGFDRDIASNGKIAIEKLKAKDYDIILMDLQMPEMNGFECTEYIRKTLNSKIPIIALTADVTTVDLAKCKTVGMNDYIAKPVDERLLYNKIVGLVKKSTIINISEPSVIKKDKNEKSKCIDLEYLNNRTKSDPKLMIEMISLYLEQTPPLVNSMKQSFENKDWKLLHSAVHKMIPSFSIMGIGVDFENMAKKVQEYASTQQQPNEILDLVLALEKVCLQACIELTEEFNRINNRNK